MHIRRTKAPSGGRERRSDHFLLGRAVGGRQAAAAAVLVDGAAREEGQRCARADVTSSASGRIPATGWRAVAKDKDPAGFRADVPVKMESACLMSGTMGI